MALPQMAVISDAVTTFHLEKQQHQSVLDVFKSFVIGYDW
jgi:hypothetical protein